MWRRYSESFVDDMPQEGVVGVVFNFSYEIVRTRVRVVHICGSEFAYIYDRHNHIYSHHDEFD